MPLLAAVPLAVFALSLALSAPAADAAPTLDEKGSFVHVLVEGEVDFGLAPLVVRAIEEARTEGGKGLFLEVNTLGGRVDAVLLIRDALLDADIPTTCYVNKRAISAGALICLSADTIDMAPGSTLGAATPVTIDAEGKMTAADEKMTSYMRKEFGATAEMKGRNRQIAEAMVDRDAGAPPYVEAGKLLTLTTEDAMKSGIAVRSSATLEEALAAAGLQGAKRHDVKMNWAEKAARIITHPVVAGILLTLAALGFVGEMKAPGHGISASVGFLALLLFFAGHKIVLLAGWEDLGLILLGVVLLALEIFVIPGFGITGVLGIVALVAGLLLAMVGHDVSGAIALGRATDALVTLSGAVIATGVALPLLVRWLPRARIVQHTIVLADSLDTSKSPASFPVDLSGLIGCEGVAHTVLRPAGIVMLGEERHDAVSEGEVIEARSRIVVCGVRGGSLVVKQTGG